jgi:hypothetical protein
MSPFGPIAAEQIVTKCPLFAKADAAFNGIVSLQPPDHTEQNVKSAFLTPMFPG